MRIWSKSRFELMKKRLIDVDWQYEFLYLNPDQQYLRFLEILCPLIQQFVPKSNRRKADKPPWSLNSNRPLLRAKSQAWLDFKHCRAAHGRNSELARESWSNFMDAADPVRYYAMNEQKEI